MSTERAGLTCNNSFLQLFVTHFTIERRKEENAWLSASFSCFDPWFQLFQVGNATTII